MQKQTRIIIENVKPQLNGGQVFIKRVVDEIVHVTADVLVDGHDILQADLLYKHETEKSWKSVRMQHVNNDEYAASFSVSKQGFYDYKIEGWVDYELNWQHGIDRKIDDNQHVKSELLEGAEYIKPLIKKVNNDDAAYLKYLVDIFTKDESYTDAICECKNERLIRIFKEFPRKHLKNKTPNFQVYVDRKKARFSTWYEFFPRSSSEQPDTHGTFKDCHRLLPRIAAMGFDTLYFPPIHPIGEVNRKGKNNTTEAVEGDSGSAWGIGSKHGGHSDIHPELGTLEDFKALIKDAKAQGIEIAMDYALQAAPDHPWVTDHPDWFKWRPDGTVQYAENPPKKYQDILPIYWETKDYKNLWQECLDILLHWIDAGITIFRVDNPHTKPYLFWNWVIGEVKKNHPDIIFLSEAFTKPKVMQQLAKQGFTQSYTYFTWRDSKHELTEYVTELTQTDQKEYMRPNFWPNTPDINPYHLQGANESKYLQRYALAASLCSNLGIYGPVFEQMINEAVPGKEEYYMSEKFQVYHYDWFKENKLTKLIATINGIRNEHESYQQTNNIKFCTIENENLMAFYKWNDDKSDESLTIISLDPYYKQTGFVQLPLHELGIQPGKSIEVHDLITNNSYHWSDEWNYVEIHPTLPFHFFKINK
ncbi:MAG: alpha-1,4-glucan--maltose-1-phosphate maltosyltransferase [Flavobacteriaceae bacterium]|nr:alpha-1,4-glucan--maltose-1-phosphate maltosyltransferase [Flavobacteriaceae bacterium]|tara:strand:- start:43961 stop:45898 length:1938 start_codon:yes stop_codon:yes gene_type:complete